MALNQRDFHQDKAKPLKLRKVCGEKILTTVEREVRLKEQFHSY